MADYIGKGHRLVMENRETLALTGIKKVQSFDPKEIILETELGVLSIKGEQLGIKQLNLEESMVDIEGFVSALIYHRGTGGGSRQGLMHKIFR
ncbi:sporulation protein YabP [Desulfosporosinus acidiphilus SJ4]|uniref:Sporulation protein YabP n=1 Tax=Desulfosporosinus acidiphilus (strain DSM 22704 / JCM 16185 / SJ4) TaxID=646529 RepID=I4D058_DESAJ|nr:sporulation protein YabP [Desulfosporosinus acidiphilus]AFM39182.1 sporulation protein YabP [Desulfosporosinus acidiphilus SJ4]